MGCGNSKSAKTKKTRHTSEGSGSIANTDLLNAYTDARRDPLPAARHTHAEPGCRPQSVTEGVQQIPPSHTKAIEEGAYLEEHRTLADDPVPATGHKDNSALPRYAALRIDTSSDEGPELPLTETGGSSTSSRVAKSHPPPQTPPAVDTAIGAFSCASSDPSAQERMLCSSQPENPSWGVLRQVRVVLRARKVEAI